MKQLKSLFLSATSVFLLVSCANWTHVEYVSPCIFNPEEDYKDLVTVIGKAECFSGDAVIEQPVTKAIQNLPAPSRYPVVAVYSFADLTGQRKSVDGIVISVVSPVVSLNIVIVIVIPSDVHVIRLSNNVNDPFSVGFSPNSWSTN